MVLQVSRLAAFGVYDWFYAGRPFPSRLQGGATKRNSAQCYKFHLTFVERPFFVWGRQSFLFHLCHAAMLAQMGDWRQAGSSGSNGHDGFEITAERVAANKLRFNANHLERLG